MSTLPCIVCDAAIEGVNNGPDFTGNQPYRGTTFTAGGQYGSTIFDPMDGSFLELNICDTCLRRKAAGIRVCRSTRPVIFDECGDIGWQDIPFESMPWNPEGDRPFESRRHLEDHELLALPEDIHLRRGLDATTLLDFRDHLRGN